MTKSPRLTKRELNVLLDAAVAYESEPANFEEDSDDKRQEALHTAIEKLNAGRHSQEEA